MGGASVSLNRGFAKFSAALQQRSDNKAQIQGIVFRYKSMIPALKRSESLIFNGDEKGSADNNLACYFQKEVEGNAHASVRQAHFNVQYKEVKKIVNGLESGEVTIATDQREAVLNKLLEISGKNLGGLSGNIRLPRPQHYTKTLCAAGRFLLLGITAGVSEAAGIIDVHVPGNPLPGDLAGHEADVQNAQARLDASQAKLDEIVNENQELYSFGSNSEAEALRQNIQNQLNSPVKIGGQEYPNLIEYAKTQYGEDSDIVKSLEELNAKIDPKVLSYSDLNAAHNFLYQFNYDNQVIVSGENFKKLTGDLNLLRGYVDMPFRSKEGLVLTRLHDPSGPSALYHSSEYVNFLNEARNAQANVNADAANLHATQESLANVKNTVHDAAVGTTATVVAMEAASAVNAVAAAGKVPNASGTTANAAPAGVGGEGNPAQDAAASTAQSKVKRNWLGNTLDFKAKWIGALGIVGYLRQLPNVCTALRSRQTSAHEYHGRLLLLCKQMKVEVNPQGFVNSVDNKTGIGGFFIRRIAGQFAKDWVKKERVNLLAPAVQTSNQASSSVSPPAPENPFKDILIKTGHYYTAKTKQGATADDLSRLQKASMVIKALHAGVKFVLLTATNTIGLLPALSTAAHWATTKDTWYTMRKNGHFARTKDALNGRAQELKEKASNLSM